MKNQDIIFFGSADWDNPYKTNQHYVAKYFSENNRVLFVESLGLRQPVFQKKDIRRIFKRLVKGLKVVRRINKNLIVFSPLVIPFHRYKLINILNYIILRIFLEILIKRYNFNNPFIFSYIPNVLDFVKDIKYKFLVYHCVDEFSGNPLIPKNVVKKEKELLQRADIVFVSSKTLFETKSKFAKKIFYLPNVANFEHFNSVLYKKVLIPEDLKNIKKPIIGFHGAVSKYKLDFELINYIAEKLLDCSIVLIGPLGEGEKSVDLEKELKFKNIFYLGPKDYSILPIYIKFFDVCILPNVINEYTKNMFPLKFFEYLALGKPVVVVDLPSLEEFKDVCYISKSYDEFVENVKKALNESEKIKNKRIELAKNYSWNKRFKEIEQILENYENSIDS